MGSGRGSLTLGGLALLKPAVARTREDVPGTHLLRSPWLPFPACYTGRSHSQVPAAVKTIWR
jgi:hypothetical protein